MVKCEWLVLRYWLVNHERDDSRHSDSVFITGTYEAYDYVGMVFPDTLYPTPQHLPVRRVEIDVFKDLRR